MNMQEFITELVKAHNAEGIQFVDGQGLESMKSEIVGKVLDHNMAKLDHDTKIELARLGTFGQLPMPYTNMAELSKG